MGTFGYIGALIIGLIGLQVNQVLAREICNIGDITYSYCEDGYYCCYVDKCCRSSSSSSSYSNSSNMSAGAIVGIVFGVIFGIGLCCTCVGCCMKEKNHPGQVVNTTNQPSVAVAAVSAHQYGQPVGPNNDGNYGNSVGFQGQPAYPPKPKANNQNPVYPPPPPAYAT